MGAEPGQGLLTTQAEGPVLILVKEGSRPPGHAFTRLHACVYTFSRLHLHVYTEDPALCRVDKELVSGAGQWRRALNSEFGRRCSNTGSATFSLAGLGESANSGSPFPHL